MREQIYQMQFFRRRWNASKSLCQFDVLSDRGVRADALNQRLEPIDRTRDISSLMIPSTMS